MGWGNPELVTTTFLCVFNDPLLDFPSVSHVFIASNQIFGAKSLWVCPALQRKGKAKLIIYPWQLICLITVAFSLFTHQKPQFPQIFGFVAITKAVKMLSHLSSCILRALKQAEKNNWIKHFSHLQIKVYNYLFLYGYDMYIFMSFYHPGSWMESEKQNFLCFCSGTASAECFGYLTLPKSKIQLLAVLTLNLGAPFTTLCPRQNIPNVNFSGSENKHFPLQEHLNPFQSLNSERRGRSEWRVWFVQRCQILLLGKERNPLLQKKPFAKTSPNFTAQNTPGWVCWKSREEWISFLSSEQNSAWFSCLVPFFPFGIFIHLSGSVPGIFLLQGLHPQSYLYLCL